MRRYMLVGVVAVGGLLAVAASQGPAAKPPLTPGQKYVFLSPAEVKRTMEVVEVRADGWVRCKYTGSTDKTERLVWLNLGQVVYFYSEGKAD